MHSTKENLQILFEDNHLIIINKRVGDIVQGDKTKDKPLSNVVKEYLALKYKKPGNVFLGVAHRLDRPTSGIVIFAKTSKALERLNKMLREKTIKKTYWAIVKDPPPKEQDTLTHYLKKNPKNNKSTVYKKETESCKKAILHYRIVQNLNHYYLLEIDLKTGRHHQIRCQLACVGSPIKGDLKYGFNRSNPDASIHLHSRKLEFIHPVSKENIQIIAAPPQDAIWDAYFK